MTLKNIGVFVDATPEGEKRIDYAATLAEQCGAGLGQCKTARRAVEKLQSRAFFQPL